MPSWLATYPGTVASRQNLGAMVVDTYNTAASADSVRDHYRELFEGQNLPFSPVTNSMGTTVRASAECGELVLSIHSRSAGSSVRVSCAVKITPHVAHSQGSYEGNVARMMELHKQAVEEMGIHRARHDAPAPPLVWPDWLPHITGAELALQKGADPAGNALLKCRYVTSVPMSQLFSFYRELLDSNGYSVYRGTVGTGRTQTGVKQNAHGEVEGSRYPDGFPGPRAEIRITFSRTYLNEPITVDMKFTTFAYRAPDPREP
jgi:hypothetical protein